MDKNKVKNIVKNPSINPIAEAIETTVLNDLSTAVITKQVADNISHVSCWKNNLAIGTESAAADGTSLYIK